MPVYVGIDVHSKRSQVAVIDQNGEVLATQNVPNGVDAILDVIGGLPSGTPAAFEAAFGWWTTAVGEEADRLVHQPGENLAPQGGHDAPADHGRQGRLRHLRPAVLQQRRSAHPDAPLHQCRTGVLR